MSQYPMINGHRYDFSSIEVKTKKAGGIVTRTLGVKDIDYSDSLEPGKVRGNHAQKVGRTRGEYDAEGSLTLYKQEFDELLDLFGTGFMEQYFDIPVTYAESGSPTRTDVLSACRIKKIGNTHSEGGEALTIKLELDVGQIIRDGKHALTNPLK